MRRQWGLREPGGVQETLRGHFLTATRAHSLLHAPTHVGGSGFQKNRLFSCTHVIVACPWSW